VKKGDQNTFGVSKTYPVFSVKRKIKDALEYYHHQLPDSLERTSSSSNVTKAGLYNNSRSFGYESIEESEKQHKQEEESHTLKSNKNNRGANVMIIEDEPYALLSLKAFL
jgi:hypothetical protein